MDRSAWLAIQGQPMVQEPRKNFLGIRLSWLPLKVLGLRGLKFGYSGLEASKVYCHLLHRMRGNCCSRCGGRAQVADAVSLQVEKLFICPVQVPNPALIFCLCISGHKGRRILHSVCPAVACSRLARCHCLYFPGFPCWGSNLMHFICHPAPRR